MEASDECVHFTPATFDSRHEAAGHPPQHPPQRHGVNAQYSSPQTERAFEPNVPTEDDPLCRDAPMLSARDGFILLVSIQIGSGIFMSPSQIDSNSPSPGVALLTWIVGGLLAWMGAASFAEFGALFPKSGGMQDYLQYLYGDTSAFTMAWMWIVIVKPASMAILSLLFVEAISLGFTKMGTEELGYIPTKLAALLTWIVVVLFNCINTRTTTRLSEYFVLFKLITVLLIALAGLAAFINHFVNPDSTFSGNTDWYAKNWFHFRVNDIDWSKVTYWNLLGHFGAAVCGGLWAYSGWDNANFIAGEMSRPDRALPRAINAAMAVVIVCFEITNVSYYILLPWESLSSNDAVAVAAAKYLFGAPAGAALSILIALSCAGALNSNVFVTGRITAASAKKGYFPPILGKRAKLRLPGLQSLDKRARRSYTTLCPHNHASCPGTAESYTVTAARQECDCCDGSHTDAVIELDSNNGDDPPINALILTSIVTSIYISIGSFRSLVTLVGIVEYTFFFLTIAGLLALRRKEPLRPRPFKPPLFVPIMFCIVSSALVIRTMIHVPIQATFFLILLTGSLLFGRFCR